MNIKSTKAALGLLLILGMTCFSPVQAESNSLTQLDINKSQADSSVEVTLYTSNPYGENVAVTKKTDNKYVILMPNLSGDVSRKPDLSGLGDMISDVDVKTVNDGGHGYTKVTLTTTKPLNVKTRLQKSSPVTPEQKAYRELIEKSRAKTTLPSYVKESSPVKVAANPAPDQKLFNNYNVKKTNTDKISNIKSVDSINKTTKTKSNSVTDKKQNAKKPVENIQKKEVGVKPQTVSAPISTQVETSAVPAPLNIKEPVSTENISIPENIPPLTTNSGTKQHTLPFTLVMLMVPIFGLLLLVKFIRNSVNDTASLRKSFINNLASKPSESVHYNDVVQDENINWQQRYQSYRSSADKNVEFDQKAVLVGETNQYSFVDETAQNISNVVKQIKHTPKEIKTPVPQNKVVEFKPRTNTLAVPIEIIEPIEIVEPPVPNPAPRSRKEKIAGGKRTKDVKNIKEIKNVVKKELPPKNIKELKKTKKNSVKKVVDAQVNKAVQELELRINKLEAEKEIQKQEIKEVLAAQNDFEKLAAIKNQEIKIMENNKPYDEEDLVSLEQLLHNSPRVETTNLNEDIILKELEHNFKDIGVNKEEDTIAANMINSLSSISKAKKFKAFEDKIALEETSRTKPLPKKRVDVVNAVAPESRHVNLGYSRLHSSARLLEGGNLSVNDLMSKSSRILNKPVDITQPKPVEKNPASEPVASGDYSMATLEEFFAMTEPSRNTTATAPEYLSNKVAASLAHVKPSMNIKPAVPTQNNATNPITRQKSQNKDNYLNGLIVKSGFNIDNNRGFYIVNLDGETALVGRIKEEIFVLKKFGTNIEKPIQVRQDNPNVYMVKADGFRSLVEVSENNMGVLIEL